MTAMAYNCTGSSDESEHIIFVVRTGFWTSAVPSDFPNFEDLCLSADDELFLLKLLHSRTTYYMHFCHHNPSHHNDTASDGVLHTPFSSLDTPSVFLIRISLLLCYIKTVISFCIFLYIVYFCTLFIGLRFVMRSCLVRNKMNE